LHNIVAVVGVCDMLGSYLASPLYMWFLELSFQIAFDKIDNIVDQIVGRKSEDRCCCVLFSFIV
jgi:hypothetical protein